MKRFGVIAALVAAAVVIGTQPGWAARKSHHAAAKACSRSAAEAEQAIRYMTDLMVVSSACRNTTYGEFALRNRLAIIAYQRAMIAHLHGKSAFDRWNTSLANQAAMRQASVPITQFCQQSQPMLQQASALDAKGFRAYAAAQAATAVAGSASCGSSGAER